MSDIPAKASTVPQTNGCLKVSSKSSPASVAGAIAGMMKTGFLSRSDIWVPGKVNQAVKAIAISRGFLSFTRRYRDRAFLRFTIMTDGEYRTAGSLFR